MVSERDAWRQLIRLANIAGLRGEVIVTADLIAPTDATSNYGIVFSSRVQTNATEAHS